MNVFANALNWLLNPGNWGGANGIPTRLVQHLGVTGLTLLIAAAVALPIGLLSGHAHRGAATVGAVTWAARAIPTLGLLTLIGLAVGIGLTAPVLALVILAIPSLLAGAYSGIQSISLTIPQSAKAIGMSPLQVVTWVELPLGSPVIIGGIRAATLQVVATATMAAYTADIGLGRYLFAGLKTRDYAQMLGGAILVTLLALILEVLLCACQRFAATHIAQPYNRNPQVPRSPAV